MSAQRLSDAAALILARFNGEDDAVQQTVLDLALDPDRSEMGGVLLLVVGLAADLLHREVNQAAEDGRTDAPGLSYINAVRRYAHDEYPPLLGEGGSDH